MPASGMVDLHNRDWGINQVFATYSVGILYECKCVIVIKVEINANASPIGDNPQKLFDAIPQYLTETLGLKREDENLYRSKDACYDIVYCKGENSFFLMSKSDDRGIVKKYSCIIEHLKIFPHRTSNSVREYFYT